MHLQVRTVQSVKQCDMDQIMREGVSCLVRKKGSACGVARDGSLEKCRVLLQGQARIGDQGL